MRASVMTGQNSTPPMRRSWAESPVLVVWDIRSYRRTFAPSRSFSVCPKSERTVTTRCSSPICTPSTMAMSARAQRVMMQVATWSRDRTGPCCCRMPTCVNRSGWWFEAKSVLTVKLHRLQRIQPGPGSSIRGDEQFALLIFEMLEEHFPQL